LNLYTSFSNDPVDRIDPHGLEDAGWAHPYPLHLGGPEIQMGMVHLDKEQHTAFHQYFRDKGFGGPGGGNRARQALGRSEWLKLSPDDQKSHISNALRAAGRSQEWIGENIDNIMLNTVPGAQTPRILNDARRSMELGKIRERMMRGERVAAKEAQRLRDAESRIASSAKARGVGKCWKNGACRRRNRCWRRAYGYRYRCRSGAGKLGASANLPEQPYVRH
jgi:hypothetical protein